MVNFQQSSRSAAGEQVKSSALFANATAELDENVAWKLSRWSVPTDALFV